MFPVHGTPDLLKRNTVTDMQHVNYLLFDVNGTATQMGSYAGYKFVGVNSHAKNVGWFNAPC